MIETITYERWQQAQVAERKLHTKSLEEGIHHYRIAYGHNFRYLDIEPRVTQVNIIEVGCADFPALNFIYDIYNCIVLEPMASKFLQGICFAKNIYLKKEQFEYYKFPKNTYEIWMFNVLQHVRDPELFIQLAKEQKTIRYFEPIDTEITDYHPHSFTKDDFDRWFPGVNKFYNETTNECFHNGPCCYGVWNNPNV